MGLSPRAGLFGGIALLSAAALLLQIVLTRIFSALFGHHLAFLAVSLSLFGLGLGGALLAALPRLARPPLLLGRLSVLACLASITSIASILFLLRQKPITTFSPVDLGRALLLYAVMALPFTFVGVTVAAAIRHASREVSGITFVGLVASGLGGVAAIFALSIGAPRAVLLAAFLCAVAGLWFALPLAKQRPAEGSEQEVQPPFGLVATMLLGTAVLFVGDLGSPWLKLGDFREVRADKVEFQKWSALSLITVDKPLSGTAWLRIDGSAVTAILAPDTNAPLHPDEMGYVLHGAEGPVLVLGAGGGREVRAALKAGQTEVHAIESDRVVVEDVMRGKYKEFNDGLFDRPGVTVTVEDGRSFVSRSSRRYRSVVLSLTHTGATPVAGAVALVESSLYTREAFKDYLAHLTPDGTLTVNRWDGELPRLLSLAAAGLRALGVEQPKEHVYACSHDRSTALLVKRTPFDRDDIQALRRFCGKNRFREVLAPDIRRDPQHEQLLASLAGFVSADGQVDLRAPTDDRPFFFQVLPAAALGKLLLSPKELWSKDSAMALVLTLVGVSLLFGVLLFLVPLILGWAQKRGTSSGGRRARMVAYFMCLGGGFVLVEMGVATRLAVFVGHPAVGLATVLTSLFVGAGLGSLSTMRVRLIRGSEMASRRAQWLVTLLSLFAVALGPVLSQAVSLPFAMRVLFVAALLAPVGVLMGSLSPLGVRLVGAKAPRLLPWASGLSGFAAMLGAGLGVFVAVMFGFSATLLLAGLLYLVAATIVPAYQGEPPPA